MPALTFIWKTFWILTLIKFLKIQNACACVMVGPIASRCGEPKDKLTQSRSYTESECSNACLMHVLCVAANYELSLGNCQLYETNISYLDVNYNFYYKSCIVAKTASTSQTTTELSTSTTTLTTTLASTSTMMSTITTDESTSATMPTTSVPTISMKTTVVTMTTSKIATVATKQSPQSTTTLAALAATSQTRDTFLISTLFSTSQTMEKTSARVEDISTEKTTHTETTQKRTFSSSNDIFSTDSTSAAEISTASESTSETSSLSLPFSYAQETGRTSSTEMASQSSVANTITSLNVKTTPSHVTLETGSAAVKKTTVETTTQILSDTDLTIGTFTMTSPSTTNLITFSTEQFSSKPKTTTLDDTPSTHLSLKAVLTSVTTKSEIISTSTSSTVEERNISSVTKYTYLGYWILNDSCNDLYKSNGYIFCNIGPSLVYCSVLCQLEKACNSFLYNSAIRKCCGHSIVYVSSELDVVSVGWKYYYFV